MSTVPAGLRTQRLSPKNNTLQMAPDFVRGFELDWLAIYLGKDQHPKAPDNWLDGHWLLAKGCDIRKSTLPPEQQDELRDRLDDLSKEPREERGDARIFNSNSIWICGATVECDIAFKV
ncbi:hypothetical protein K469DRAFT_781220 [Zopfia rhizophila CBS 207.26]|uniref:Uncharacterized protein n=1 Tax=Zopfia rhizophila CBS 207.26 TaxID=1314779 RepID=A0A6A6E240_9PEZI|nr:hypothetical protein K469DRAFT_781220 [Zopfia rhizophila CBS 207.26]